MMYLEAEKRIEEAKTKRQKAERARRRQQAEINLQQVSALSKLKAIRAKEQAIGELMHESRSAVNRVRWKGH